jgi:adenylosuccinate synthase
LVLDVPALLASSYADNANIIFEGAQGALLDIDHGTYPYVTSSNTTAGGVATGSGFGPRYLNEIVGVTKAYCTRVGHGPFPTELTDEVGKHIAKVGHEFGATTGRARRCGWFDAVALRRSAQLNSLTWLAITKLDILDELKEIKICTQYRYQDQLWDVPPIDSALLAQCEPIYESWPGWQQSTKGLTSWEALPKAAKAYIERISELVGVPISMVSTGADRVDTIMLTALL